MHLDSFIELPIVKIHGHMCEAWWWADLSMMPAILWQHKSSYQYSRNQAMHQEEMKFLVKNKYH